MVWKLDYSRIWRAVQSQPFWLGSHPCIYLMLLLDLQHPSAMKERVCLLSNNSFIGHVLDRQREDNIGFFPLIPEDSVSVGILKKS